MPTARKLPSGSWRVRVYDYTSHDGKKHYKSFTAATKKQAEFLAANFTGMQDKAKADMSFRECAELYVRQREPVLSVTTAREYSGYTSRYLRTISDIKISRITQEDIQREVNSLSTTLSPKTVRNVHGFISAVLSAYRPELAIHTVLPKNTPPKLYIPSENDVKRLMNAIRDTDMELPVLLAAFGPMRRGEICALRAENISGTVVHVCENMVLDKNKNWIIKTPKSYTGDRYIDYPQFVAEKWSGIDTGRIVSVPHPDSISHRFEHILKRAGLPHFRFHDLRHYSASIQHALGIPDAYIMQRGGWKNDSVLKQVYRHALTDKAKEMNEKVNQYFEKYDTKYDTKK